ncbi:MAG: arginine--tRNA ligase [Flavobacteriaceae bacterium]
MSIQNTLQQAVNAAVLKEYNVTVNQFEFQATRKNFEGDITLVVFSLLRYIKGNPVQIGQTIGQYLKENLDFVSDFNVVKGFLNIVIADNFYTDVFNKIYTIDNFGFTKSNPNDKAVMVEYSSPNTNKPLHLGHIRNNLLGYSVAKIIEASGKKVLKTQIINDRGIHICKSMLAWQKFGNGETPESTGLKGDKLVGNYYVRYDKEYKAELAKIKDLAEQAYELMLNSDTKKNNEIVQFKEVLLTFPKISINNNLFWALGGFALASYFYKKSRTNKNLKDVADITTLISGTLALSSIDVKQEYKKEYIEIEKSLFSDPKKFEKYKNKDKREVLKELFEEYKKQSPLLKEAQKMLKKWEAGDADVVTLWKTMNQWVYDGFEKSYKALGVDFDINYYESNTYLLGKDIVNKGLEKGVFYKKDDGSVWIDLTNDGLDEKIVLRADGTAVYMTQDIGTAIQRFKDYDIDSLIYTVGNEQDYHFKVLFLILKKLGFDWADKLYHLSYGMVDLPSGKMKSREGTVVDADDLIVEMAQTAKSISQELGKLEGYSETEKEQLYKTIGLGALKYFILKVDPKKRILFDPAASIDFNGNTGPFIQYTYARIQSILRKANFDYSKPVSLSKLDPKTKELIKHLELFTDTINLAADNHSPALIANYTYDLVKLYNSFYQTVPILGNDNQDEMIFHIQLSKKVSEVIKTAFSLLGIDVPERM